MYTIDECIAYLLRFKHDHGEIVYDESNSKMYCFDTDFKEVMYRYDFEDDNAWRPCEEVHYYYMGFLDETH